MYKASLSQREVTFLAGWERERRRYVTSEDLRALAGAPAARAVASALVRKGVLQRIGKGLYLVRPLRSLLRPTRPSSPFVLGVLLHSEPYYLGGRWALAHHGLTGQQVVSLLDAFVTRRRPPRIFCCWPSSRSCGAKRLPGSRHCWRPTPWWCRSRRG